MNTILLDPTDILFFRDGRPMNGSLSGHGAAWPLPTVVNYAFHAALHRSNLLSHQHVPGKSSLARDYSEQNRQNNGRRFGSLTTAGPFPVKVANDPTQLTWYFPRPADANDDGTITLFPHQAKQKCASTLPAPCKYPVINSQPPNKNLLKPWWSSTLWKRYLTQSQKETHLNDTINDQDFCEVEHNYGIEIENNTGSVVEGQFYSAHYLRLNPDWRLGVLAEARDKAHDHKDIIPTLLQSSGTIIIGGQQRVCSANRIDSFIALPHGATITGTRVKWILLTPAIFPAINEHTGGWLPSWIRHSDGKVMLKSGNTERQKGERRDLWRQRLKNLPNSDINAHLVAAIVGKPVPVTGWALLNGTESGAKSTHLAVPAGSVYYFECDNENTAKALAAALNWHGSPSLSHQTICNRRSTLMGEKGFGLGVCGTWDYYNNHNTR